MKKTTVSLSDATFDEIEKRGDSLKRSQVIDRALYRYYDLINTEQTSIRAQFKPTDLKKLSQVLMQSLGDMRVVPMNVLRAILTELANQGKIDKAIMPKISALSTCTFLALIDLLESPELI